MREAEIVLPDDSRLTAEAVGRDPGTNVAVFRLSRPVETMLPPAAEPRLGALALAFGAAVAVLIALWAGAASAPAAYVVTLSLAVPASALLTFAWRRSR
jgi:hypothetical protein